MPLKSPLQLIPGLILAEDVYNLDAKLLFPSGTELNEKKIEILMMWGVESVSVQGSDQSQQAASTQLFSDTVRHDAEIAVQKRFKLVKSSHPAVIAIREIAILETAKSAERPHSQS